MDKLATGGKSAGEGKEEEMHDFRLVHPYGRCHLFCVLLFHCRARKLALVSTNALSRLTVKYPFYPSPFRNARGRSQPNW